MGDISKELLSIICKVSLVSTWIKRREVVNDARRFRSEKLREYQYIEGYASYLENKYVEWDENRNIVQMLEQVKRAMADSAREGCGSVRMEGKKSKNK